MIVRIKTRPPLAALITKDCTNEAIRGTYVD